MAKFYEFFAGGGMARAGLGARWECTFANDFDSKKAASYAANWGCDHLRIGDVAKLSAADLPGSADLAWASFPCQDLSLAGGGAGLKGERSGTFWPFWKLMEWLAEEDRAPRLVVLENVCGALTSHGGRDFAAIGECLAKDGYRFGAMVMDGVHFVPQSRPRLFIVGVRGEAYLPESLVGESSDGNWHHASLIEAYAKLSNAARESWMWWRLPKPPQRKSTFADVIEDDPSGVRWHTPTETKKLLDMMSPINASKVAEAKRAGRRVVGGIYKRTRANGPDGAKVQRAEIRFDDVAGCLRTPAGGSSRQLIMVIEGEQVRSRLISPRECARLMGLPDSYQLPGNANEAYHLTGDGLIVPVVQFLAKNLLEPLLSCATKARKKAA